jgi:hypothetical protein
LNQKELDKVLFTRLQLKDFQKNEGTMVKLFEATHLTRCTQCPSHSKLALVNPPYTAACILSGKMIADTEVVVNSFPSSCPLLTISEEEYKLADKFKNKDAKGGEHYKQVTPEPIVVILAWHPDNYCLGNSLKYIARCGRKGTPKDAISDLDKAIHYLEIEKRRLQEQQGN